ncbi:MAG: DUF4097 family beta strand repeat-containing protein [Candidatus Baltobacteraceae bacterium]
MKRLLLPAMLCAGLASCGSGAPALKRSGILQPGGSIVVRNLTGDVNAYAPARGGPADRFSVDAYAATAHDVDVSVSRLLVRAQARAPGVRFLVRAPKATALDLSTMRGNIGVQDYEGIVNAHTDDGDIKMLIPAYGSASAGRGSISAIFASDTWPGTLHFSTGAGNVEVYVNQYAKARVRMHTADGTVFSDFDLTGTSHGQSETIDASINGGGPRSIDIEVKHGSIRVMQLKPQV